MSAAARADVAARVAGTRERIAAAAERAGRSASDVTLVGACKRQPIERVVAAIHAGVRHFAENYVQEARARRSELAELLEPELHNSLQWLLAGPLQRNKSAAAVELFERVDSLDRESLAIELDKRAASAGRKLPVCIQVNVSGEAQKNGVSLSGLPDLLAACANLTSLTVTGLMTLPAANPDPEGSRRAFAQLRELRDSLRKRPEGAALHELSMGMSGDFEVAIEEGATLVRVGTALFGAREG